MHWISSNIIKQSPGKRELIFLTIFKRGFATMWKMFILIFFSISSLIHRSRMEIPRWFKFILLLSILRQEFVSADNICRTFSFHIRQNLVADHALEGHVFKVATVTTIPECHIVCINDCRCVSMNYEHKTAQGNCQMNDANRYMKPAALRYKYGALYYDLVREYSVSDVSAS